MKRLSYTERRRIGVGPDEAIELLRLAILRNRGKVLEVGQASLSAKMGNIFNAMYRAPATWPMRIDAEAETAGGDTVVTLTFTDGIRTGTRYGVRERLSRGFRELANRITTAADERWLVDE